MTNRKINIKKILFSLLWVTIGISTVVLLVAAAKSKENKVCKSIEINIQGVNNNFFIDKKDVLAIINKYSGASLAGKKVQSFDLRQMEAALKKDVWIRNAELFFDNNNVLQVSVEEREPVARIFTVGGDTYYIDSSAAMLPLSDKFSARVPVFTDFPSNAKVLSHIDSALLLDIRNMSMEIQSDSFLMAMIDQVDITKEHAFEMTPKIGDQQIFFGDASDAAAKFRKLKLFYKNIIEHTGWNHYSSIDLQYDNQVVAKIRGKEDKTADSLKTLQLMQAMADNAERASVDSIQNFIPDNDKSGTDTSMIQHSFQRDEEQDPEGSTPDEKPTVQMNSVAPVVKPQVVMPKPVTVKPVIKKPVAIKPVAKPAVKPPVKKPVQKPNAKKPEEKRVPKAVMKANDY
jgi:cell division protein FtsQ